MSARLMPTLYRAAAWSTLLIAAPAFAQQVPGAGELLRETRPAAPPVAKPTDPAALPPGAPAAAAQPGVPVGPSFVLNGVRFAGNTIYSGEALAALAREYIGQRVTFADLTAIAERVTARYREDGYLLALAVVPRQEISGGIVEISVLEGRLGKLRIERAADAPVSEARVAATLSAIEPGKPLNQRTLERSMLMLSDLPGIAVQSSLEAGSEAGTTELVVEVAAAPRWSVILDADNYGSESAGKYRAGTSLRVNSPSGAGDNLDLRVMHSSGSGLNFGRLGYERPLGYGGTRFGVGVGRLSYELGQDFAALGAQGTANIVDASLLHPLLRSRSRNLFIKISYEHKRLKDEFRQINVTTEKRIDLAGLGLTFEGRDSLLGGGYVGASVSAYAGDLRFPEAAAELADQSGFGRRTKGGFSKLAWQVTRFQGVTERTNLYFGLTGQFANKNLDSAEKISLGGPRAVRAYSSSEVVADEGTIAVIEYRLSPTPDWTFGAFYDEGWGRVNRIAFPGEAENYRRLAGYGLGLFFGRAGNFAINASLAWRDTARSRVANEDRNPRLYVQGVKSF